MSSLARETFPSRTPVESQAMALASRRRRLVREGVIQAVLYLILVIGGLVMLAPFLYILTTSLKDVGHIYSIPPQWMPWPPHLDNYVMIFQVAPFHIYARNTVLLTVVNNVGELTSCSIVAFGFARLRGKGRNVLFLILLATLMIPSQVSIIPTFVLFKTLHWYDTFYPLTVPAFFGNAFYIFLLRQYMMTIPLELDDAAKIDGCNWFTIFVRIVLPLSVPALVTISIFDFLATWNDFFGPLIYLSAEAHKTLALGLACFQGYLMGYPQWHLMMGAAVLVMLPCLILFFFLQRYFIGGIVMSGLQR